MRVLFSAFPGFGHVYPLLPMAVAAQRAGHDVVIASGPELPARIDRFGLEVWEVGETAKESEARSLNAGPSWEALPQDERMRKFFAAMFAGSADRRAADLIPLAMEWKPDLIVHDVTEPAAAIAAVHTEAGHASLSIGRMPAGIWPAFGPALDQLGSNWAVDGLSDRILDAPHLDTYPRRLQPEGPADFRNVWALRPTSGEVAPEATLGFDPAALPYPDSVYLTLGTVANGAPGVFETVLAGLAKLAVNVIITVGPGVDDARLGDQPPHVAVADFLPQSLVLPACRVVVSHGGGGTMIGALCHGLPQLILPQGADQFLNAEAAQRAGVAIALQPDELGEAAVTETVTALLTDTRYVAAAANVRTEIDAVPDAAAVLDRMFAAC